MVEGGEGVSSGITDGASGGNTTDGILAEVGQFARIQVRCWAVCELKPRLTLFSRKDLAAAANIWGSASSVDTAALSAQDVSSTRKRETARRHAFENRDKALLVVQSLELRLGIEERWRPESAEWTHVGKLVAMRKYQRALDVLEGLIVARMFELTKMNRSQTGTLSSAQRMCTTDKNYVQVMR